jgi:nitroimidazol reductase NimA-like FMN-containing flavoprotein (pyridoxamine 5'-phosphate oxidase superfamily)
MPPSDLRTPRTTVKRLPKRGLYDRGAVDAILDEGMVCHVGFVHDGQPFVLPTGYARLGDTVYLHGSPASRMLTTLSSGVPVCVTVTLLDGLVLARSAFHSSMNYRSVVILGTASPVTDRDRKLVAMRALVDHLIPDRWPDLRPVTDKELRATLVLELPLREASAKVRTGGPVDDEEDYALTMWAGVVPLGLAPRTPIADERLPSAAPVPAYARRYRRPTPPETRRAGAPADQASIGVAGTPRRSRGDRPSISRSG